MENRQLLVTMRDGSVWAVDVEHIAWNRTEYYHRDTGQDLDEAKEETEVMFRDDYEIVDWATNEMNWSDVAEHAVMVQPAPPLTEADFQEGWVNGEHRVVTQEAAQRQPEATP